MTPYPLKTITPQTELSKALELLTGGQLNQLPVVEGGQLVGMLSRADVLRFLQLRDESDIKHPPGRTTPDGSMTDKRKFASVQSR